MTRKVCFKCQTEKDRSEFYKHPQMGDGLLGKCKTCTKADVKAQRLKRHEYYMAYDRKRFQDQPQRKELCAVITKRNRERWPHKYKARQAVSNAVRDGRLARPSRCSKCGDDSRRIEGHHEDYSKLLEVVWLCSLCHKAEPF